MKSKRNGGKEPLKENKGGLWRKKKVLNQCMKQGRGRKVESVEVHEVKAKEMEKVPIGGGVCVPVCATVRKSC